MHNDTERLEWILNTIFESDFGEGTLFLVVLGINEKELEGPGEVPMGELIRKAIDRKLDAIPSSPIPQSEAK